jgi:hypothetical protein
LVADLEMVLEMSAVEVGIFKRVCGLLGCVSDLRVVECTSRKTMGVPELRIGACPLGFVAFWGGRGGWVWTCHQGGGVLSWGPIGGVKQRTPQIRGW